MSIVDELIDIIEYETANRAQAERIAAAVLTHLAAKAGDVRGMLPNAEAVGRISDRIYPIDNETARQWYARIGNVVLDLCAERIAPVIGALRTEAHEAKNAAHVNAMAASVLHELRDVVAKSQTAEGWSHEEAIARILWREVAPMFGYATSVDVSPRDEHEAKRREGVRRAAHLVWNRVRQDYQAFVLQQRQEIADAKHAFDLATTILQSLRETVRGTITREGWSPEEEIARKLWYYLGHPYGDSHYDFDCEPRSDEEAEHRARVRRAAKAVWDLTELDYEAFVLRMRDGSTTEPDDPIVDPEERARAVAKIMRGRGICASALYMEFKDGDAWAVFCSGCGDGMTYRKHLEQVDSRPRAIADAIQAEEARRAQEWAGDVE